MSTNSAADDFPLDELMAHAAWLRRLALRLVRDAATADDLVQEAWVAAIERPPATDRPLRPWLGGVLRNLVKRRARTEHRRTQREERVARRQEPLPSPDALAERLELQRELAAAVAELDEPFRSTLQLRYDEGLSAAEIARREGVPAGTVRWRLKTALDRVRERLDQDHDGDRRAWVLMWIPLVARDALPTDPASAGAQTATAATGGLAALIPGALAMSLAWKLTLGAVAVVVLAVGLTAVVDPALFSDPAPETPVAVTFEPQPERVRRTRDRAVADEAAPADDDTARGTETDTAAPPAALTGRVVDTTGRPVPGALVTVSGTPGRPEIETDQAGRFELRFDLPDADWGVSLTASARAHAVASVEVRARRGQELRVADLVLPPGGAIRGVVRSETGVPLAGARIELGDAGWTGLGYDRERRRRSNHSHGGGTTTDDSGWFELSGVPVGVQRVWAMHEDHLATVSGPIEVREGQVSTGVVLSLPTLGERDLIAGQVRLPDGSPAGGAKLRYRYDDGFMGSGSGSMTTDAEGRFRRVVGAGAVYQFTAQDRDESLGQAGASDVRPGTTDLVLRLTEPRYLTVTASADGSPVSSFTVTVIGADKVSLHEYVQGTAEEPARAKIPGEAFVVRVEGLHHDEVELGPFEPDAVPEQLEARLTALPGLVGTVLHDGEPVVGAVVTAHAPFDDQLVVHNGFETRWNPQELGRAKTDADGRYRLVVRETGTLRLRVSARDLAPAARVIHDHDPKRGQDGLDFELTAGATLTGRTQPGAVVGLSGGTGHPRTVRADDEGVYRFEHLAPGAYQVRAVEAELIPGNSSMTMRPAEPGTLGPVRTNVTIGDAPEYRHDLMDDGPAPVVVGMLRLGGVEPLGWRVLAMPLSWSDVAVDTDPVPVAADGSFRVELGEAGDLRLLVQSPDGRLSFVRELTAERGETRLELDVRLTSLTVLDAPSPSAPPPDGLPALIWRGDDGWTAVTALVGLPESGAELVLDAVPVGTHDLVLVRRDAAAPDPTRLPAIHTLDVTTDGETVLDLGEHVE